MNLGGFPVSDAGDCLRLMVAFVGETDGARLEAAWALSQAVAGAATTSDEPAVCATQLEWWRAELERLANGEPRHPAAQAFAERLGVDDETHSLATEWVVDAERRLFGPAPDDVSTHRITGFRRYGSTLLLATAPDARDVLRPVLRDTAIAFYALDAVAGQRVFDYDTAIGLAGSLRERAATTAHTGAAVLAATAATALQRRYDGLKPGGLRLLLRAWRSARRSTKYSLREESRT